MSHIPKQKKITQEEIKKLLEKYKKKGEETYQEDIPKDILFPKVKPQSPHCPRCGQPTGWTEITRNNILEFQCNSCHNISKQHEW